MKKIIAVFFLLLTLSGCSSFSNRNNISDLLSPPKLSEGESQIIASIKQYMNEDVVLKYPKQVNNFTPIQILDIDDDMIDDAIVLYTVPNVSTNVWLAILTQQDGNWVVSDAKEGYGTEVSKINIANISQDNKKQIVVGYTFANQTEKLVTIYFVEGGKITSEYTENCQYYIINDVTQDDKDDLIVAGVNANGVTPTIRIISTFEHSTLHTVVSENLEIYNGVVTNIKLSNIQNADKSAIVVDYKDNNKTIYTQAFYFDEEKLNKVFDNNGVQKHWNENYDLVSRDIDGDGFIEIPTIIETQEDNGQVYYMEWTNYLLDEPVRKFYGVCDVKNGVYIALPDEWQDHININIANNNTRWNIKDNEQGELLVDVQFLAPSSSIRPLSNQKIISLGVMQIMITFDERLDSDQIEYIANNIIYIK